MLTASVEPEPDKASRLQREGENFRSWRESKGWTQEHAAELLEVSRDAVRFWEYGRREIPGPVRELRRYIDRFGPIPKETTEPT